jgi:hypothetical protein
MEINYKEKVLNISPKAELKHHSDYNYICYIGDGHICYAVLFYGNSHFYKTIEECEEVIWKKAWKKIEELLLKKLET